MAIKETKRILETPLLGRSKTSERSISDNGRTEVPLTVNCNPFLIPLGQVKNQNIYFIYQDEEVKQASTPNNFVSFRRETTWVKEM